MAASRSTTTAASSREVVPGRSLPNADSGDLQSAAVCQKENRVQSSCQLDYTRLFFGALGGTVDLIVRPRSLSTGLGSGFLLLSR
jgi:hypothetical protein